MPLQPTMTREDQINYIRRVLALTGWSQTVLAKRSGLDPSTLSRFLSGDADGRTLRVASLSRVSEITGVKLADDNNTPGKPDGFSDVEAEPIKPEFGSDVDAAIQAISARRNNVDPWILHSRALELAGYFPGDILLVSLNETPLAGDVVCAQIYDWAKSSARTVFRLYQPPFLMPATTHLQQLKPFSTEDGTTVIKGVVLHSLRSRRLLRNS